jgi:hypothetical protein
MLGKNLRGGISLVWWSPAPRLAPQGLEDQLLGEVVRKERPDLEEAKDRLVVSISADKKQLQELEDKVGAES